MKTIVFFYLLNFWQNWKPNTGFDKERKLNVAATFYETECIYFLYSLGVESKKAYHSSSSFYRLFDLSYLTTFRRVHKVTEIIVAANNEFLNTFKWLWRIFDYRKCLDWFSLCKNCRLYSIRNEPAWLISQILDCRNLIIQKVPNSFQVKRMFSFLVFPTFFLRKNTRCLNACSYSLETLFLRISSF